MEEPSEMVYFPFSLIIASSQMEIQMVNNERGR